MGNDAILAIGTPIKNIGAMAMEYKILTGDCPALEDDEDFKGYVARQTQAEYEQAIYRLRPHQRPDENLTFYAVTNLDLSFLGLPVFTEDAAEITPEAGDCTQQAFARVEAAASYLLKGGEKLTQDAIATVSGFCQAQICKLSKKLGGWDTFKKLLLSLLSNPYTGSNNFNPGKYWFAEEYLPALNEDLKASIGPGWLEDFADFLNAEGDRGFEAISNLDIERSGRLLGAILGSAD